MVVALLPDAEVDTYRRALHAGASAGLVRTAPPETLVATVTDALAGRTTMSTTTLRALLNPETPPTWLTADDIVVLRKLAFGTTYDLLAHEHHLSPRTMFRRIHELFERMGASSRVGALTKAARWGVLED